MLTVKEIRDRFSYDPATGVITRKTDSHVKRWRAGMTAGGINGQGYREIKIDGKSIGAHRIAWVIYYGDDAPEFIDHINRNPADNRIVNLRAATKSQNGANRTALSNNKYGFKGCYWVPSQAKNGEGKGKWRAQCRVNKKLIDLGKYDTVEAAQAAYNAFSESVFGEFYATS